MFDGDKNMLKEDTYELVEWLTAKVKGRLCYCSCLNRFLQNSDVKMKAELVKLLALYSEVEENGGCATLTLSTREGKSIFKFTLESPPPPPATTSTSSSPASGRRRRNRGAAARARRKQRAAAHQDSLAAAAIAPSQPPSSPTPGPPSRPLKHLLSPTHTSGRRRVMSVGRPEMPSFSSLNLDGSSSPPPAPPPFCSPLICYDDCEIPRQHCDDCGKCIVLCPEHFGCGCDGLDFDPTEIECAICYCTREVKIR